jgi:clostripain
MVFLNAKNDLERFGISDMNEMETVGSNDNLNIVVQMGRIKGYDSSNGDWTGVRRYYVTKDTDRSIINSQLIENMGEVDMGSYKTLIDFAKWAKKTYPAKKYALVIWNHGSGWEKGFKSSVTKGISYDEQSGNHINTPQLGMAMKEIGKVDILDFDACLMQMAEVAYEIKDYVTYIVASEETEPGDGDSYDGFLSKLTANPTMGPLDLAKAIVDAHTILRKEKAPLNRL